MRRRVLLGLSLSLVVAAVALTASGDEPGLSVPCDPGPGECPVGEALAALERFWAPTPPPAVRLATGRVDTGCGEGSADEGSFYCPQEETIYLQREDLDGVDLAPEVANASGVYLLAHEYAHAVQDARGLDPEDERTGPASITVRYELQADCLAGVFVASVRSADRSAYAEAVRLGGDDVGPDPLERSAYAHGSAEQRLRWFTRGVDAGEDKACDTFAVGTP